MATSFSVGQLPLGSGLVVQLVPANRSRMRLLLAGVSGLTIGPTSGAAASSGFLVGQAAPLSFFTSDAVYGYNTGASGAVYIAEESASLT